MNEMDDKQKDTIEDLTTILNKFNKKDIISNFLNHLCFTDVTHTKKGTFVQLAIKSLMKEFPDVYELELYLHSKNVLISNHTMKWTFYELQNGERFSKSRLTAKKISECFLKYFKSYATPCAIWTENIESCIWIALYFGNPMAKQPAYVVLHLKLSAVFLSDYYSSDSLSVLYLEKIIEKTLKKTNLKQVCEINESARIIVHLTTHESLDKLLKRKCTKKELRSYNAMLNPKNSEVKNVNKLKSKSGKNNCISSEKEKKSTKDAAIKNSEVKSVNKLESKSGKREKKNSKDSAIKNSEVKNLNKFESKSDKNDCISSEKEKKSSKDSAIKNSDVKSVNKLESKSGKREKKSSKDCAIKNCEVKNVNKFESKSDKNDCISSEKEKKSSKDSGIKKSEVKNANKLERKGGKNDCISSENKKKSSKDSAIKKSEVKKLNKFEKKSGKNDCISSENEKKNSKESAIKNSEVKNVNKFESRSDKNDCISSEKENESSKDFAIRNSEVETVNALQSENETEINSEAVSIDSSQLCNADDNLPEIKKLTYYVKSHYFGDEEADGDFSGCVIELKGENVLRGLKRLVESGVVESPLPPHLWELPIDGKTTFQMEV